MAIRYNMTTGQGTYADGTAFTFDNTGRMVSETQPLALSLHPEADARLAAATGGQPLRVDAWIGDYGTAIAPDGTRVTVKRNADGTISRASEARHAVVKGDKVDADAIPASPSDGKAYRIEAAVNNGPTFALVGTLAEIDARLRSGFVGVDVATGATGKASEWPMVAEKMRGEVAGMMAPASSWGDAREKVRAMKPGDSIAIGGHKWPRDLTHESEPAELRLAPNENGVGSRLVPAPRTLLPGDDLDAIIIGGIRIACPTVESGSADGFTLSARVDWETGRALQMVCTTGKPLAISTKAWTREASPLKFQSARVPFERVAFDVQIEAQWSAAPGSYARAQAVDFTGAGATLTDRDESVKAIRDAVTERMQAKESQRTKPAALAAGQVWMCGDTQWILDEQEPKHPSFWNARTSIGQRGLLSASTVMGMQYIGTREDVAARESAITDRPVYSESICRPVYGVGPDPIARDAGPSARAMRVGAAVAEGMARGVASAPAMGLSRTPLGTMTGAPAPAGPYRSAPAREPEPFALPSGAALDGVALAHYDMTRDGGETDEAFRARIVETLNDYRDRGTRPWFQRRIARALRVSPEVIDLDESTPFVVKVRTRDNCVPMSRLAEACDAMREHMPCGVTVVASHYVSPLAALRAEIDRLVAADHGPFAHARAAALRSLAECPEDARRPMAPSAALSLLRTYEEQRGGAATPATAVRRMADTMPMVATYERERARSDAYARPSR